VIDPQRSDFSGARYPQLSRSSRRLFKRTFGRTTNGCAGRIRARGSGSSLWISRVRKNLFAYESLSAPCDKTGFLPFLIRT